MGSIILSLAPLILQVGSLLINIFYKSADRKAKAKENLQAWVDKFKDAAQVSANQHINYAEQVEALIQTLSPEEQDVVRLGGRNLKMGDRNGHVVVLQKLLVVAGFSDVSPDGDFGPATDAAIRLFQKKQGLVVDGIVKGSVWAALAPKKGSQP